MGELSEQNLIDQKKEQKDEDLALPALEEQLLAMEKGKPGIRKDGKGDPKYEILFKLLKSPLNKDMSFQERYGSLKEDFEKHAIITRLENIAREGKVSYGFVEKFRRELYGTTKDEEGTDRLNYENQWKLEQILQDMWFGKKKE